LPAEKVAIFLDLGQLCVRLGVKSMSEIEQLVLRGLVDCKQVVRPSSETVWSESENPQPGTLFRYSNPTSAKQDLSSSRKTGLSAARSGKSTTGIAEKDWHGVSKTRRHRGFAAKRVGPELTWTLSESVATGAMPLLLAFGEHTFNWLRCVTG
jgi:hypothetical protein